MCPLGVRRQFRTFFRPVVWSYSCHVISWFDWNRNHRRDERQHEWIELQPFALRHNRFSRNARSNGNTKYSPVFRLFLDNNNTNRCSRRYRRVVVILLSSADVSYIHLTKPRDSRELSSTMLETSSNWHVNYLYIARRRLRQSKQNHFCVFLSIEFLKKWIGLYFHEILA